MYNIWYYSNVEYIYHVLLFILAVYKGGSKFATNFRFIG